MLANHVFWRLMLFITHLLLMLQPSVLWLSIVSFNNDAKPPTKWILREFDVSRIRPQLGGLPHLERLHGKIWPLLERVTRSGRPGYPPWRVTPPIMYDHMDRRATLPKRVTSPTWGPPPPCKQALRNDAFCFKNWTHTDFLSLISSGKFNGSCFVSYVNWFNWFFLNLQKLDLVKLSFSFPGHSYFY